MSRLVVESWDAALVREAAGVKEEDGYAGIRGKGPEGTVIGVRMRAASYQRFTAASAICPTGPERFTPAPGICATGPEPFRAASRICCGDPERVGATSGICGSDAKPFDMHTAICGCARHRTGHSFYYL